MRSDEVGYNPTGLRRAPQAVGQRSVEIRIFTQAWTATVGGKSNTVRNEELKIDENSYKPAYMLVNEKAERDGSRK